MRRSPSTVAAKAGKSDTGHGAHRCRCCIHLENAVVPVVGVTGGQAPGRLAYIANIKIGDIRFFRAYLIIADLQVFDVWGLADRPALFIGMNFLRQASEVTIDFGRKELRFKLADIRMASRG